MTKRVEWKNFAELELASSKSAKRRKCSPGKIFFCTVVVVSRKVRDTRKSDRELKIAERQSEPELPSSDGDKKSDNLAHSVALVVVVPLF